MTNSNINFEKFAQDANLYIKELAEELGHPEEKNRAMTLWRAVMHTIRDRIHMGESFQIMDPLPMIFKGAYTQGWKYTETPPLTYNTVEEMTTQIEKFQKMYGEQEFSWSKPTEELFTITLNSLKRYMSEGQLSHIKDQMPKDVKEMMLEVA